MCIYSKKKLFGWKLLVNGYLFDYIVCTMSILAGGQNFKLYILLDSQNQLLSSYFLYTITNYCYAPSI